MNMTVTNENSGTTFIIPTVDISSYLKDPQSEKSQEVVSQIRQACRTSGFFQIVGHGIGCELQDAVIECARKLFDLPLEEKAKLQSAQGRGYELVGSQTLQPGMKADMKEVCFDIYTRLVNNSHNRQLTQ
jgi:isopenicillin N synthase-like dioxygenase